MGMKPRVYAGVFGALAIATLVEVSIASAAVARATLAAAILAFAAFKGLLIASYYMHLRYERSSIASWVLAPLFLLILLSIAMALD